VGIVLSGFHLGEGGVQGVRSWVRLAPYDVVYDPELQPLQREPEAEDDVVGSTHPERAVRLEDAPRFAQPPHVERVG
jgi:hypothetical protein